jgi:hypothetical protein
VTLVSTIPPSVLQRHCQSNSQMLDVERSHVPIDAERVRDFVRLRSVNDWFSTRVTILLASEPP